MEYKKIKEELKRVVSSVKYFDKKTFDTILKDKKEAANIVENGGDVQEFYKNSDTSKTRFYLENSGAYCELLSILANA